MKKRVTAKRSKAPAQARPDLAGLIEKMGQHLLVLERKLDTLINRSSERPLEPRFFSNPYQRTGADQPARAPEQPSRPPAQKQNNNVPRERIMHKAICADCNASCEVPFKPSSGRPVYCKECFVKRRNGGQPKDAGVPKVEAVARAQKHHVEKAPVVETRKPVEKKKKPSRKRK